MATKIGLQTTLPASPSKDETRRGKADIRQPQQKKTVDTATQKPKDAQEARSPQERQAFLTSLQKNKDLFSADAVIGRSDKLQKKSQGNE
jgi:hypothetical protein